MFPIHFWLFDILSNDNIFWNTIPSISYKFNTDDGNSEGMQFVNCIFNLN